MLSSAIPTRQDIIWGASASGSNIRTVPDTTSDPNAASFTLGFPPNTFVNPGSGGDPPDGRDFNGALNAMSAWCNWIAANGPVLYNSTFQGLIGGYPKFAMLPDSATVGLFWISSIENNTNTLTPGTGGTGWQQFPPAAGATPVTSFNTRTGAVTLTSADVVSALATNSLVLGKLATIATKTLLGNDGGSGATPAALTATAALDILGFTGTNPGSGAGVAFYPQAGGAVLCQQWGTHAAVAASSNTAVTLSQGLSTSFVPRLTTHSDGTGFHNCVAMYVDGSNTGSQFTVNMQNFAAGGSPPTQAFSWEIWGYV